MWRWRGERNREMAIQPAGGGSLVWRLAGVWRRQPGEASAWRETSKAWRSAGGGIAAGEITKALMISSAWRRNGS